MFFWKEQEKEKAFNSESLVTSYNKLRIIIGLLGFSLPIILPFGTLLIADYFVGPSISSYYHSVMRDALVGIVIAMGFMLMAYRGFDEEDLIVSDIAGFWCLVVAWAPTAPKLDTTDFQKFLGVLHNFAAVFLFLCFSYFCLVLFIRHKKSLKRNTNQSLIGVILDAFRDFIRAIFITPAESKDELGLEKWKRNKCYRFCGRTIVALLVVMGIYKFFLEDTSLAEYNPLFYLEWAIIWVFSYSWFVKGEAVLGDP